MTNLGAGRIDRMADHELAPLQPFLLLRDEYHAISESDDPARFGEVQDGLRGALAAVGWEWPEDECWLPMRCPDRGYCTQFLEGAQDEPCGWWPTRQPPPPPPSEGV
jgi:hypothetical protein